MNIGIVGVGGIGLGCAAWAASRGHIPMLWAPRGRAADAPDEVCLESTGVLESRTQVRMARNAQALAAHADAILIAVPMNGHKAVMDALLPQLQDRHTVIVSSMGSLSSLYLYESARARGVAATVASFGTTVLTARRQGPASVRIMTRRPSLSVSCLPGSRQPKALALCESLFGAGFTADGNALASALANINPVGHGPMALLNWTRIERAEHWPQYHYLTPRVAAVIERLDAERRALAAAFGLEVRSIERHLAQSFGAQSERLADIAAELHAKRGGPPGPTDMQTRYLHEDVPYGLVFLLALGRIARVPVPAMEAVVAMAGLVAGEDFASANELIPALRLPGASVEELLARVNQ